MTSGRWVPPTNMRSVVCASARLDVPSVIAAAIDAAMRVLRFIRSFLPLELQSHSALNASVRRDGGTCFSVEEMLARQRECDPHILPWAGAELGREPPRHALPSDRKPGERLRP